MLRIDLHTHSIASGHALNTVYEMALVASRIGVTHLGITDHGPSMKGPPMLNISGSLISLRSFMECNYFSASKQTS